MDRTREFAELILACFPSEDPTTAQPLCQKPLLANIHDEYTREAYQILGHIESLHDFLLSIRQVYLQVGNSRIQSRNSGRRYNQTSLLNKNKISSLTDIERDEIDFEAKAIIRQMMHRLNRMESLEKDRRSRIDNAGFLKQFIFTDDTSHDIILSTHRGAMLWYLSKKLSETSEAQRDQQETRLIREVEKSKSMVNKTSEVRSQRQSSQVMKEVKAEKHFESTLSQEQLQILEEENHSMIEGFEQTLDQIKSAEKALLEISTLQSELLMQLNSQASVTDRLYDDAIATIDSIEMGNKQLIRAKKRHKSIIKVIFTFLMTMALLLLFLDSWY